MVMEPNQQVDGNQTKIDYPQNISIEFQQPNAQVDTNTGSKGHVLKPENSDSKAFQPSANGPESMQQRPFGPGYGDMQRPSMYGEGMMTPSADQPHYPPSGSMAATNNSTSLAANNTPTLNQLLTQNPTPPKYPPGYGDYSNSNSAPPGPGGAPPGAGGAPAMYDGWNSTQQQNSMSSSPARPGMPLPNRPMANNSPQVPNSMYDRPGMHQNYRHPNPQFNSGYPQMVGGPPHQGYPPHSSNPPVESGGDGSDMDPTSAQQRMRPMMAPGRMMGPPRAPGPHQTEPGSGQMMPPPNQSQGYPGMYPYGSQPYRNAYGNYPTNQMGSQMSRSSSQSGFTQGPMNQQHQVNGPHKSLPPSPGQPLGQPINQPSPGGSSVRGVSPAPNQQSSLAASPASSTNQSKALSPCPSPSVSSHRSMPPSPATTQLNSPHPGLSPRPESVSSPRTDASSLKPDQISSLATAGQSVNQAQANAANQSEQSQSQMKGDLQQSAAQGGPPQHMMAPHQMRMLGPGGMNSGHPNPAMGNGMPSYGQRMPGPGQPPNQYQQANVPYPQSAGTGPQYPPNHNQMGYPGGAPPQGPWPQSQQMGSSDMPRMPSQGAMYSMKNDKGHAPSPLSATQSPSAVASPHGSDGGRRPSSRKSSDAGSHKSQKPVPPNTVHGTSMDVFNRQVEMGPETQPRRQFMDHLCAFYLETSKPFSSMPAIGKNPLDLYKVYTLVKEKGGFQQVCKKKLWKQICTLVAASTAANAAYTLKKAYIKYLLNYECKYDLAGADPQQIINSVETKKERQNRNAPSPAGSGNSQDAQMRGYPDYPMAPGGPPSQVHPPHMPGGTPMRPSQYHDPNMPPHQPHGYMNYNSMGGAPTGMPNGHHPMPPHQGSMSSEDSQQMSQGDPNTDAYHQQMGNSQYNSQQMSAAGYQQRHPFYGPRMPVPGGQRPPFHQQPSVSGPQQAGGPPGSQIRMPQQQSGYPPMYRDSNSYPSSQSGAVGPSSSAPTPAAFPSMGGQASMSATSASSTFPQSSVAGANQSQISANANMGPMQHPSPAAPIPRYPHRATYQTQTRGALSAMLSNSAAAPDSRASPGQQWRQRAPMPPPGYPQTSANEPRRQPPVSRQGPPTKKEIVFPPGSVEATPMNKMQRKPLHSKHIGKIDCRRLLMCLRSGLLCETVWALDSISIYLKDDSTNVYFNLGKMPALFEAIVAHYKQSLALMFEELSDLVEGMNESRESSVREVEDCESISENKELMLGTTNYSWSGRNGMKVIIDPTPKNSPFIPSVSMYSKKSYVSHRTDYSTVVTYETSHTNQLYTNVFSKHARLSRDTSSNSLLSGQSSKEDVESTDSHTPASSITCGNDTQSSHNVDKHKMEALPVCNGCITYDIKGELSKHSCESSDLASTNELKAAAAEVKLEGVDKKDTETAIDRKVAESSQDLKELEVKLSHSRKRRFSETIDIEPVIRDEPPLEYDIDLKLEEVSIRCLTLANILRGLSFIPQNEKVMAESTELLLIFGRLLNVRTKVDGRKEKRCWWWDTLEVLREHTLVTISNVAGYIQLIDVSHEICFPFMDGLLFWATTNAAYARDPLPHTHSLCIRNLVMEILCKMCAHCDNMNLLLSTPPHERINSLFQCLAKLLSEPDQVRREFALVIVSCLAQADSAAARGLAMQTSCISQLISILESAESAALSIAQQRGVSALRDKPEAMGTSLDMIRRTSATLVEMAQVAANREILLKQQDRLLNLVMSQILDQHVAKMLSDVLYECTKDCQMSIAPSYVISDPLRDDSDSVQSEPEGSVKDETELSVEQEPETVVNEKEGFNEIGKENIEKSSSLETNNAVGVIAAS